MFDYLTSNPLLHRSAVELREDAKANADKALTLAFPSANFRLQVITHELRELTNQAINEEQAARLATGKEKYEIQVLRPKKYDHTFSGAKYVALLEGSASAISSSRAWLVNAILRAVVMDYEASEEEKAA